MPYAVTVFPANGTVMVLRGGAAGRWTPVLFSTVIDASDAVRTAPDGGAWLVTPGNDYILLGNNATAQLSSVSDTAKPMMSSLLLRRGKAYAAVKNSGRFVWELVTPTLRVRVNNGRALVQADDESRMLAESNTIAEIIVSAPGKDNESMRLSSGKMIFGKQDGSLSAEIAARGADALFAEVRAAEQWMFRPVPSLAVTVPQLTTRVPRSSGRFELRGLSDPFAVITVNNDAIEIGRVSANSNGEFSLHIPIQPKQQCDLQVTAYTIRGVATLRHQVRCMPEAGLDIIAPREGDVFASKGITFSGITLPGSAVSVQGYDIRVASNGMFGPAEIQFRNDGVIRANVHCTGSNGVVTNRIRTFTIDTSLPALEWFTVEGLRNGTALSPDVTVRLGTKNSVYASINGFPLTRTGKNTFEGVACVFADGAQTFVIELMTAAGKKFRDARTIIFDTESPYLTVKEPIELPSLSGVTKRGAFVTVRVNDAIVIDRSESAGFFSFDLSKKLAPYKGHNVKITVSCEDRYGRKGIPFTVTRYFDLSH